MINSWNADTLNGMRLGSCLLESPLGIGGMGAVYLARQERPHRRVAVKVLRPQLATDPEAWRTFLERFRREADATAALDHANIVPIYEFGEQDNIAYLVMPYLADGSLAGLLEREGAQPLSRVLQYAEQAAAALDYAHAHGIVHRDVKPSNLLLHPDGRLLLADFGIARLLDRSEDDEVPEFALENSTLTQTGSAMGTPEYMSPEQVRGEHVGPAADIYALGIVAYVMLMGRSPFAGGDITAVMTRQLVSPPQPLRIEHPEISPKVEEAIFYAMAKEPGDRPATAGDFARALRAASRGRTLSAMLGWSRPEQIPAKPPRLLEQSQATALVSSRRITGTTPLAPAARARMQQGMPTDDALQSASPPVAASLLGTPDGGTGAGYAGYPPTDATLSGHPLTQSGGSMGASGGNWRGGASPSAPEWPAPGGLKAQRQRTVSPWLWIALVSAVVVVLVGSFAVASMLAQGGLFPGIGTGVLPGAQATHTLAPTPTITPSPTATPGPTNWLTVSTTSVSLGCKSKNRRTITLRNIGPDSVSWSAQVQDSSNTSNTGINISPKEGQLDSGHSVTISVTNNSVIFSHQGTISFVPDGDNAGQSPAVTYSTTPCGV
ncbi:MAG TPA: serine/threonine-protein kinase [Ktedonobacterales bacterium]